MPAAEQKILTIDFTGSSKPKKSYDLKKYDVVQIKTAGGSGFLDGVDSVKASGTTLTVKTHDVTLTFKNVSPSLLIQAVQGTDAPYYNETFQAFYYEAKFGNSGKTWLAKESSTKVTGTAMGEEIDLSSAYNPTAKNLKKKVGVTINAGAGNDTITGTRYNDTITGGLGENIIVVKNEEFGGDVVKLTKGEDLILDLTAYYDSTKSKEVNITEIRKKLSIRKNDLLLDLDNGTVKLASFAKSNVVGDDGSVKILLKNAEEEVSIDLNSDNLFSFDSTDFTRTETVSKGKVVRKTATFNGTRFSETIDTADLEGYNKTIKAGDGENTVNMTGTGTNTIILGKDNDTINIGATENESLTKTTVKAGKGNNNVININSKTKFGEVIIAEEKVGATNVINFQNGVDGYTLYKSGDDLIIMYAPDRSCVKVQGYYASDDVKTKKHYATIKFQTGGTVELTYNDLVTATGGYVTIEGKGSLTGTNSVDHIIANDYSNMKIKASNDTITGGAGNDTIYGGLGKNTIVFYDGDGVDTVKNSHGEFNSASSDTLLFKNAKTFDDLNVYFGSDDDTNLYIEYGDSDKVIVEDYQSGNHSVKNIKVGKSTKSIESIMGVRFGADGNDIFTSATANETFYLGKGNDTLILGKKFGKDDVYSETDSEHTDTLKFTNYSLQKGTLDASIHYGWDGEHTTNEHVLEFYTKGGTVEYHNFLEQDVNLNVVDSSKKTYKIVGYSSAENLDLTNAEEDKNKTYYLRQTDKTKKINVVSNNKTNNIETLGGAGLDYTYNGGHDYVHTDESGDDYYNVNSFTTTTDLTIYDEGGKDTVHINEAASNIRMLIAPDYAYRRMFIHKDNLTVATVKAYLTSFYGKNAPEGNPSSIAGVRLYATDYYDPINFTRDGDDLEHFTTADHHDDIELTVWQTAIETKLDLWLEKYKFENLHEAMKSKLSTTALEDLLDCYDVECFGEQVGSNVIIGTSKADTINMLERTENLIIKGLAGDDIITAGQGNDEIDAGTGDDTIYLNKGNNTLVYYTHNGNDTVHSGTGEDTLKYADAYYAYNQDFAPADDGSDDLWAYYGPNNDNKIILKDYMKGNHSVKYFYVNGEDATYHIPYRFGTAGNDTFDAEDIEEHFYVGTGDDTISFDETNRLHMTDYIYSDGGKDTIELKNYSYEKGEFNIHRTSGRDDYHGELIIDYSLGNEETSIKYQDAFSTTVDHNVDVVDKNGTINVAFVDDVDTLTWNSQAEANKNHVAFLYNNGKSTIVSNGKRNHIHTLDTASLDYTYNGGNDTIRAIATEQNDTYTINSFTVTSKLSVLDGGGSNDVVDLKNADSSDFYLMFDVTTFPLDEAPTADDSETGLVYKDAMTVDTLKSFFKYENYYYDNLDNQNNTIAGVLKFQGGGYSAWDDDFERYECAAGCTIETYKTNDKDKLDILAWKKIITGRVAKWLENNSSVEGKNLSFYYYSVIGVMEAIENGEVTLTDDQYESLLDCYKVSYSEVPESKEFASTTGDDTYTFGPANNTVTYSSANMGKDVINSSPTEFNESYLDRIIFTADAGLSVKDGTLAVKAVGNDLVIGKANDLDNNKVTYTNFFSNEKVNNAIIYDSSGDKYYLRVNDKGIGSRDKNHIAFVYNDESAQSLGFGTGKNYIYSYGETNMNDETRSMWICSYGGGNDTVVSNSTTGNDGYEVYEFSATSQLNVTDNGGANDSLTIYYTEPKDDTRVALIDKVRLVFNVDVNGAIYDDFMLVHEDALNKTTLKNTYLEDSVAGVLRYNNATHGTADSFCIETFKYYQDDDNWRVDLNIDAWKNEIVSNVQAWLTSAANSGWYTSAYGAFATCEDPVEFAKLVECYNVDYTTLNQ